MKKKIQIAARRAGLTPREIQIAERLAAAASAKRIADELEISIFTVRFHIRGIYKKFLVHCSSEFFLRLYLSK